MYCIRASHNSDLPHIKLFIFTLLQQKGLPLWLLSPLCFSDSHSDCVRSPGYKPGRPIPQEPHTTSESLCAEVGRRAPRLLHGQAQRISPRIDRIPQQTEMSGEMEKKKLGLGWKSQLCFECWSWRMAGCGWNLDTLQKCASVLPLLLSLAEDTLDRALWQGGGQANPQFKVEPHPTFSWKPKRDAGYGNNPISVPVVSMSRRNLLTCFKPSVTDYDEPTGELWTLSCCNKICVLCCCSPLWRMWFI